MASIAELMAQSGLASSQQAPDLGGSISRGAELAQTIENMQAKKAELEGNKAGMKLGQMAKTMDLIKMAHDYEKTDPAIAASLWKHAIPAQVSAFGTQNVFTPEFMETAQKSPETRMKVIGYQMEIQDRIANKKEGERPQDIYNDIVATIPDPAVRAALDTDRILKAQEQQASEEQLTKRAKIMAGQKKEEKLDEKTTSARKEYTAHPTTKKTIEVNDAFSKIQRSLGGRPSAAGDMAGVFSYMKMLDPGSTVREGEYANAQNAGGVPDKVLTAYNGALKGEILSPDQRKNFISSAKNLFEGQRSQQKKVDQKFEKIAHKMGADPELVIIGTEAPDSASFSPSAKQKKIYAKKDAAGKATIISEIIKRFPSLTKEQAKALVEAK